jgi:hypothetical protein
LTEPCTEKSRIAVIETYQEEIRGDVKTILKVLQGNGDDGIVTRVSKHKTYFRIIAVVGTLVLGGRIAWSFIFP